MSVIEILLKSKKTVFNTNDLALYWSEVNTKKINNLAKYYVNQKKLFQIYRGLYSIVPNPDKYDVAQALTSPSYIGLMTALNYHGINFQYSDEIHIVSNQSKVFKGDLKIIVHKLNSKVLYLNDGIIHNPTYSISNKERTICDILYLYPAFTFDNLNSINWEKVDEIGIKYSNKRLLNSIKKLKKYAQ
jgi:predicted transcriptional regulator of viral defense system